MLEYYHSTAVLFGGEILEVAEDPEGEVEPGARAEATYLSIVKPLSKLFQLVVKDRSANSCNFYLTL